MPAPHRRLRLFCFCYAGGNPFGFMPWQAALDPSIEVCAVHLPGRGARIAESPIASMPALLRALAPVIMAEHDLPCAFFGHSLGALIAFELARYLRLHGVSGPTHLIASGCQAPRARTPPRQLHTLPDEAFIDALGTYNGTLPEVLENRQLMALLLPALRADFGIAEQYVYRHVPLLRIPISVFAGTLDDNKAPGQIDGWAQETTGACQVSTFDGRHFFIHTRRDEVLGQLNVILTESLYASRPSTVHATRS